MAETERVRKRQQLTRERVLDGALLLADEIGIEAFTMRRLADALGVSPMTIYHYVSGKDEIIDLMVEAVFAEIERPPPDLDWKTAIRHRCLSAREVLNRHPWAPPLMESRTSPGPANLGHHDAVIGTFRRGGLSIQLTAHAYAIVDSFVYGFALEEANLPSGGGEEMLDIADEIAAAFPADEYPHLMELVSEHVLQPGYRFADSFDFGLDLILAGLDAAAGGREPGAP